jgi:Flp pilus assembly protein TadG
MIHKQKRRGKTKAQALVEFALVFPLLMFLIFAIIDFGWMIFNYAQLYNSLREGLRYGSVTGYTSTAQYLDCDNIRATIIDRAGFSGIKVADITIIYDDGRPAASATSASAIGSCTNSYTSNPSYVDINGGGPRDVGQGDRINIALDVNVPFLTPFIRVLVPGGGLNIKLYASRSVFPGGL